MEISYKNKKLEKQLTDPIAMIKTFGQLTKKINQRIKDLSAAENLGILRNLPSARCHELSGERNGELSVDVSVNYRLIFEPKHEPIPNKDDGGLNWNAVTSIQINEIEDYH